MTDIDDETTAEIPAAYTSLSTAHAVTPRYIAASIDSAILMLLAVFAAKSISNDLPILQLITAVVVCLAYFFLFEGLISSSPGKLLTGLVVVGLEGERCSWRQAAIRTAFRLLEVNPMLLGAIPAALCVLFAQNHQRFGDKVAETLVIERRELRRHK